MKNHRSQSHPPTSAQLRDRQKTKDLTRIADSLNELAESVDDILELLQNTVEAITYAANAACEIINAKAAVPPPQEGKPQ